MLTRSINDLQREALELYRNARLLHPDLPFRALFPRIIESADPGFLNELDSLLRMEYFQKAAKLVRAQDRQENEPAQEWLFPEIRTHASKLPKQVPIGGRRFVKRPKVVYEDLKRYLQILTEQDRKRHQRRIVAVLALMKLWPARTKKNQGITLTEVDRDKAREAGLI